MDDKLREIIESKKDDREVAEFAGITLTLAQYDFLIEQAERVHELESELNKQIEIGYKFEGEAYDLAKENKRYREALEETRASLKEMLNILGVKIEEINA